MDFIVKHARENVWAERVQDKDYYIKPARITPNGGSLKYADVGLMALALPNNGVVGSNAYHHVYHIGQIPTAVLGIDIVENHWTPIDVLAEKLNCYVNVFLDNGCVLPRSKCYLLRTWPGKNVILAIEYDPKASYGTSTIYDSGTNSAQSVPNTLNNQGVNIRFYTNARHFSEEMRQHAVNPDKQFYFQTGIFDATVANRIRNEQKYSPVPQGWFIANGLVMNYEALLAETVNINNKEISVCRDETIIGTEYFKLNDLAMFVSERTSNIHKYIINLHNYNHSLVFYNDVEYYLGSYVGGLFRGVCIPLLRKDSITTVTNRTHAIRVDVISDLLNQNPWINADGNATIMAVVRQGGMLRGLIHQHSRIEELFKLPDTIVTSAMTGINSLLSEWTAANLEVDDYAKIVEAKYEAIVEDTVFNAYGYNAITRYHHPNPLVVDNYTTSVNGTLWYSVQLSNAASERNKLLSSAGNHIEVIEYDASGGFVGRRRFPYMNGGMLIASYNANRPVKTIEHFVNSVEDNSLNVGEIFDASFSNNDLEIFGFSAYISTSPSTSLTPKWVDVTEIASYYNLDYQTNPDGSKTRRFTWNNTTLKAANAKGMVRINNRVCFKTFNVRDLTNGYRDFPVVKIPMNALGKVPVEVGNIDIWMEDKLLIEDIDYVVKWPNIYVGRRIGNMDTAQISVRLSGLANPNTSEHFKARETGFVSGGVLSVNKHYDIRNDRNIQINVAGSLFSRDQVSFDEEPTTPSVLDGRPYQIKDYITPVELYSNRRTLTEKHKSELIDGKVMDYLNEYLDSEATKPATINNTRWLIVSVFLDDIICRLLSGWLLVELQSNWSTNDVTNWVQDVLYLLEVDVAYGNSVNRDYVRLIPHGKNTVVTLSEKQYAFVDQVAQRYLGGMVQLNHMITISVGG